MCNDSKSSIVAVVFALGLILGVSPTVWASGGNSKQPAQAESGHDQPSHGEPAQGKPVHDEAQGPIEAAIAAIKKGNSRKAVCQKHCTSGACSGVDPFRRPLKEMNDHKLQLAQGVGTACAAICNNRQVYNCMASFKKVFHVDPADPDALRAAMEPVVHENHQTKHLMCSAGVLGVTEKYENMIESLCK